MITHLGGNVAKCVCVCDEDCASSVGDADSDEGGHVSCSL